MSTNAEHDLNHGKFSIYFQLHDSPICIQHYGNECTLDFLNTGTSMYSQENQSKYLGRSNKRPPFIPLAHIKTACLSHVEKGKAACLGSNPQCRSQCREWKGRAIILAVGYLATNHSSRAYKLSECSSLLMLANLEYKNIFHFLP